MTHTITDAELAQLREALTFHVEYDGCIECERIRKLLDTIAARTQEPIKKADLPERIFLQISKEEAYDTSKFCGETVWREVTWCEDRINDADMLFIREDLIPAPQPAAVPDGWQPIETAPKDGKRFLGIDKRTVQHVVVWLDGDHPDADEAGWYEAHTFDPVDPIHWMPLPAAPKEAI